MNRLVCCTDCKWSNPYARLCPRLASVQRWTPEIKTVFKIKAQKTFKLFLQISHNADTLLRRPIWVFRWLPLERVHFRWPQPWHVWVQRKLPLGDPHAFWLTAREKGVMNINFVTLLSSYKTFKLHARGWLLQRRREIFDPFDSCLLFTRHKKLFKVQHSHAQIALWRCTHSVIFLGRQKLGISKVDFLQSICQFRVGFNHCYHEITHVSNCSIFHSLPHPLCRAEFADGDIWDDDDYLVAFSIVHWECACTAPKSIPFGSEKFAITRAAKHFAIVLRNASRSKHLFTIGWKRKFFSSWSLITSRWQVNIAAADFYAIPHIVHQESDQSFNFLNNGTFCPSLIFFTFRNVSKIAKRQNVHFQPLCSWTLKLFLNSEQGRFQVLPLNLRRYDINFQKGNRLQLWSVRSTTSQINSSTICSMRGFMQKAEMMS